MKNNKIITVFIAILIGTVGGFIFAIIKVPLPWMLGAMVFVTIAAVSGVPSTIHTHPHNSSQDADRKEVGFAGLRR